MTEHTYQDLDSPDGPLDRYDELLVDDVLWGLEDDELQELDQLARSRDEHASDRATLEATGAAVAASFVQREMEQPPAEVRARMEAMALHFLASEKGLTVSEVARSRTARRDVAEPQRLPQLRNGAGEPQRRSDRNGHAPGGDRESPASRNAAAPTASGHPADHPAHDTLRRRLAFTQLLAAASLLVAVALFVTRGDAGTPLAVDGSVLFTQLTSGDQAPELVRYDWTMPGGAASPDGEVVWDPRTQSGVMIFRNLSPTEANRTAYQLWIFDGERDKAHPVDGGVFDIARDGTRVADGTVYVPIDAKLTVAEAFAFAVTEEQAGGVVVSDRERIVSLAGQIERL